MSGHTAGSETNVRRLRSIRVLVLSRDRRFLRVTTFLLGRHGFDVETAGSRPAAYAVIERQRTDVAVVDAAGSVASAAGFVAAIEALYPHVATVVVDGTAGVGSRLESKWEGLDDLGERIERAYLRFHASSEASADAG